MSPGDDYGPTIQAFPSSVSWSALSALFLGISLVILGLHCWADIQPLTVERVRQELENCKLTNKQIKSLIEDGKGVADVKDVASALEGDGRNVLTAHFLFPQNEKKHEHEFLLEGVDASVGDKLESAGLLSRDGENVVTTPLAKNAFQPTKQEEQTALHEGLDRAVERKDGEFANALVGELVEEEKPNLPQNELKALVNDGRGLSSLQKTAESLEQDVPEWRRIMRAFVLYPEAKDTRIREFLLNESDLGAIDKLLKIGWLDRPSNNEYALSALGRESHVKDDDEQAASALAAAAKRAREAEQHMIAMLLSFRAGEVNWSLGDFSLEQHINGSESFANGKQDLLERAAFMRSHTGAIDGMASRLTEFQARIQDYERHALGHRPPRRVQQVLAKMDSSLIALQDPMAQADAFVQHRDDVRRFLTSVLKLSENDSKESIELAIEEITKLRRNSRENRIKLDNILYELAAQGLIADSFRRERLSEVNEEEQIPLMVVQRRIVQLVELCTEFFAGRG